jgi:hypothetical protein
MPRTNASRQTLQRRPKRNLRRSRSPSGESFSAASSHKQRRRGRNGSISWEALRGPGHLAIILSLVVVGALPGWLYRHR